MYGFEDVAHILITKRVGELTGYGHVTVVVLTLSSVSPTSMICSPDENEKDEGVKTTFKFVPTPDFKDGAQFTVSPSILRTIQSSREMSSEPIFFTSIKMIFFNKKLIFKLTLLDNLCIKISTIFISRNIYILIKS